MTKSRKQAARATATLPLAAFPSTSAKLMICAAVNHLSKWIYHRCLLQIAVHQIVIQSKVHQAPVWPVLHNPMKVFQVTSRFMAFTLILTQLTQI